MKLGDEYEVNIDRLTNLGLGLAKIDGFIVFVDGACPNDKLKIKISKLNKHYAKAKIVEIIEGASFRTNAFCPIQKVCGACQIQYIDYNYQLIFKQNIVKETLYNIGNIDIKIPKTIPSPQIKNFRHKVQYPVSQTVNSKRIIAGYYKPNSHEIVNIKYCPIQPQICDEIIDYIRNNAPKYKISGYCEKKHIGDLRHVNIRISSYNGECLLTLVINNNFITSNIKDFAQDIYTHFEKISGVCINYNSQKTNLILGKNTDCICGNNYIKEKILDKFFIIGADTFFQVNPKSAENIFKYVKDYIKKNFNNPSILDAYAGISAFGICLSDEANKVVTIEENLKCVELAQECLNINKINNVEINSGDAREFFKKEKRQFDVVILDPPRKGCNTEALDNAFKLCKDTIIYVSCNPATLARDLKYLKHKQCEIISIQPFDMFCHSYHIENVAIIKCSK